MDRFQGRLDSPLTEAGKEHAVRHARLLELERVEHLVASPLGRARSTAEIIAARLSLDVRFDDRLVERDVGVWTGRRSDEISREFPIEWAQRTSSPYFHAPPGGENLADVLARVQPLLDELTSLPHHRIAIVSHGVVGRVIVSRMSGLEPEHVIRVRQPNNVVYRLSIGASGVTCEHFRDGEGPIAGFAAGAQPTD